MATTSRSADFTIKANDRRPSIAATLTYEGGATCNLSSATEVNFIMKIASGGAVKVNSEAVIVDATTGKVRYDWTAVDTNAPGDYLAEWEVTWGDGARETFPTKTYHSVSVLADLDGIEA